jgi:beta-galactosidase
MRALPVVLLLLLLPLSSTAQRTTTSFNDGWVFHAGDDIPWPCAGADGGASDYPVDLTNVQLTGLTNGPANATDPESCRAACGCTCQAWQWGNGENGSGCWLGLLQSLGPSNWVTNVWGWVGGGRYRPATPASPQTYGPASVGYNDSATFVPVQLPHDYIAPGTPTYSTDTVLQRHGYLPIFPAWYRKTFVLPQAWQTPTTLVRLRFNGVLRSSAIFLQGNFLLHHESGYTSFDVWLHNATGVDFGVPITLAVHVDPLTFSEGWYMEGGGIVRDVELVVVAGGGSGVSIAPFGVQVVSNLAGPVTASSPNPYDGPQTAAATVAPNTDVSNAGSAPVSFTVTSSVLDQATGAVLATDTTAPATLPAGGWTRVSQSLSLPSARLWFPAQNASSPPSALYTLATVVNTLPSSSSAAAAPVLADSVNTTFGIRNAIFDANTGLLINGFPVKLTGFAMHQDFGGCGAAVPANVVRFRVQRLLELGANAWRTAHQPPDPLVLDETDRRGVLVWEENRLFRADPAFQQDAQDMVLRDRNHPSILLWSLCNENGCLEAPGMEGAIAPSVAGAAVATAFMSAMFAADGTRPVTGNTHALIDQPGTILDALDVLGVTYDEQAYDTLHEARPWVPVMGGEAGSCVSDRGFSPADNDTAGTVGSYDPLGCSGPAWAGAAQRPWIAGNFLWAGADYAGESMWPAISSHYGIIDLCGFPKPVAHAYSTWWGGPRTGPGGQPVGDPASLFAYPAWDGAGYPSSGVVTLVAYSSAALVGLVVNGEALANVSVGQFGYAQWDNVRYEPGSYTVTAFGNTTDGQAPVLATYSSVTPGAATALNLTLAWPGSSADGSGALVTDGLDTVLLTASALDAAGTLASPSDALVTWNVTGPAVLYGLCNGNPTDHTPVKGEARALYAGLSRAVVQSTAAGPGGGVVTVTVTSPGLAPATLQIRTAPAADAADFGRGTRGV